VWQSAVATRLADRLPEVAEARVTYTRPQSPGTGSPHKPGNVWPCRDRGYAHPERSRGRGEDRTAAPLVVGQTGLLWGATAVYRTSPFSRFSNWTARASGHPAAFAVATAAIVVWLLTGPVFGFSDTWQLVINTATTIVTFLMVFLIQNTQNRDGEAVQLKLDEIIRALNGAHNALLDLEELPERELNRFRDRYESLARRAREDLAHGVSDTGSPDVTDG
jgi:low affinity Fe/Cu permease